MNPEVNKIGRLVQCRCHHTCISHDLGYQWLLPRTKSKHMLYDRVKNKQTKKSGKTFWFDNEKLFIMSHFFFCLIVLTMKQLEDQLASISIRKTQKKRSFKISLLLQKKLKQIACEDGLVVLKEFTVKSSVSSTPRDFRYGNDYY
jgi:hypothetical protein